jgi:hypothetical protein
MDSARERAEEWLAGYDAVVKALPLGSVDTTEVRLLRALLASEPAKAPFVSRNEEWGLRPDFTTAGVPAPPDGAEVSEAAESDVSQLRRLQRAEALLLDVWDAWHREGHEQSETIDAAIDRLGDWRWNEGYDPSNPPLRPDPRKARAARRGGQKGER